MKTMIKTPFSAVPTMTRALENVLGKVEKDIKESKNMSPVFSSAEKANAYLDNCFLTLSKLSIN